jgi:hypothetical protein
MKTKLLILALLSCQIASGQYLYPTLSNTLTQQDKIYYFSRLWSDVRYNFVNIDQLPFDMDSVYYAYIPEVLSTTSDYDYYRNLQKFLAHCNDGHAEIFNMYTPYQLMDYFSLSLINLEEKVYITAARIKPGIDTTWVGAEILEIDNIPIKQYLQDSIFPYVSASTPQHRWMQGVHKIAYNYNTIPFNAKIRKLNNEEVYISLPRNGEATRTEDEQYAGILPDYSRKLLELRFTEDSIGILNIRSFNNEEKFTEELEKLRPDIFKAKKLIIDIRRNGGGSTRMAWLIQEMLTPGRYFLNYGWYTRVNNGVKKANSNWREEYKAYNNNSAVEYHQPDTIYIQDSIRRITCPVVILVGNYTFSAAEDFLVNLYEVPNRPVLIGEPTGGSTGSPLVVKMTGNSNARICTRRIAYPYSGKSFVNEGVQPDIIVKQNIYDYISKNDVVLEAGLKYLREQ